MKKSSIKLVSFITKEDKRMSVARVTEIISDSKKSFEDAVVKGVKRANKTLDNVKSAWVKDQQAVIEDGEVVGFRVVMKITFILK